MTTKAELIAGIASDAAVSKDVATRVLTALTKHVHQQMQKGGEVMLPEIGKFSVAGRAARKGRNPRTGDEIDLPAKRVPHFSAAKALKDAVTQ